MRIYKACPTVLQPPTLRPLGMVSSELLLDLLGALSQWSRETLNREVFCHDMVVPCCANKSQGRNDIGFSPLPAAPGPPGTGGKDQAEAGIWKRA